MDDHGTLEEDYFVEEDLDVGEDGDGEGDELEAEIALKLATFKKEQAIYNERVRAIRPWSDPPLDSPMPEKQRSHELLPVLKVTSTSILNGDGSQASERSEYVPPNRPNVEQSAAKGGPAVSYMAPPRSMSADSGDHRLSRTSGASSKSGLLEDILEDGIPSEEAAASATSSFKKAADAALLAKSSGEDDASNMDAPSGPASAITAPLDKNTDRSIDSVECEEAAQEEDEDKEEEDEVEMVDMSALEQSLNKKMEALRTIRHREGSSEAVDLVNLQKKLDALRTVRQRVAELKPGVPAPKPSLWVVVGSGVPEGGDGGDLVANTATDTKSGVEEETTSVATSDGLAAPVPAPPVLAPPVTAPPAPEKSSTDERDASPVPEILPQDSSVSSAALPAPAAGLVQVSTSWEGSVGGTGKGRDAALDSPLPIALPSASDSPFIVAPPAASDSSLPSASPSAAPGSPLLSVPSPAPGSPLLSVPSAAPGSPLLSVPSAAPGSPLPPAPPAARASSKKAKAGPEVSSMLDPHTFALQLLAHDLRSMPGQQSAANLAASRAHRQTDQGRAAHPGTRNGISRPLSAPSHKRPTSAASALPAMPPSRGSRDSRLKAAAPFVRRPPVAVHRSSDGMGPDVMFQVSRALRCSVSTRERAFADLPRPAAGSEDGGQRAPYQPQAGSMPSAGTMRQRPASACTVSDSIGSFQPVVLSKGLIERPPVAPSEDGRPKRWRPMSGQLKSSADELPWADPCDVIHGPGPDWLGVGNGKLAASAAAVPRGTAAVGSQPFNVYKSDTAKRISEANRYMNVLGSDRRYKIKEHSTSMDVLLLAPEDTDAGYGAGIYGIGEVRQHGEAVMWREVKSMPLQQFLLAHRRLKVRVALAPQRPVGGSSHGGPGGHGHLGAVRREEGGQTRVPSAQDWEPEISAAKEYVRESTHMSRKDVRAEIDEMTLRCEALAQHVNRLRQLAVE